MFAILTLFLALQMPGYTVDTWGNDDGVPSSCTSFLHTDDGYMWIGCWGGLFRFDGVRFTPVPNLPNTQVMALRQDPAGNIWIGTNGGGVIRMDRRTGTFQSWTTAEGLSHNEVFSIELDGAGGIWVGTISGLNHLKDGRIRIWRKPQLPDDFVQWIQRGPSNRLWISTHRGVCEVRNDEVYCGEIPLPKDIGVLNAANEARDGSLWLATGGAGIKRIKDGSVTSFNRGDGHSWTVMQARNGDIWIPFGRIGSVSVVRNGEMTSLPEDEKLPRNTIRGFYEDPEGSIWIGFIGGGLARLRPKRVTTYTTANGLPHDFAIALTRTTDDTVWAGFNCGPPARWNGTGFEVMFRKEVGKSCTFDVRGARDGSLWIPAWGNALFKWKDHKLTRFGIEDGPFNYVSFLFDDSRGGIWMGTPEGRLNYMLDGTIKTYPTAGAGAMAQTPDGKIWLRSGTALSVFSDGRFEKLGPESGLPSAPAAPVQQLYVDGEGDLWVSTSNGLFRRAGDRFISFAGAHPSLSGEIGPIVEDLSGNLWVAKGSTITRFLRSELEAFASRGAKVLDTIVLDRRDGVPAAPEGRDAVRTNDGKLWFGSTHGIIMVDPAAVKRNDLAPPVAVENVPGGIARIAAGTRNFDFQYTGLSLLDPAKVKFQYQLEGYDRGWIDAETRRTAYYTRMAPGEYTFKVRASNNDGVWSREPASIRVVIEPFVWERRPVQALALAVLLFVTVLSTRAVFLRRARKRLQELEREQALERERKRIAQDLHDEMGSRLTRIALMADRGTSDLASEARSAIQAMDELVWTVNAKNDTVEGFIAYALAYTEEQLHAAGIRLRIDVPADIPVVPINADARRHLFMAFKEALNNIVKHSGASEVQLGFRVDGAGFRIEIRDNGRGFDDDAANPAGNGLPGMKERLAAAGGRAEIRSARAGGTTVSLMLGGT